ncbi:Laminin subunit gamma-1 [Schistosoma haematobium]|uniref:Laminin subunit gamma-1 n=1 Tax=Schistosoma haematobium TaxID=6185 RepID=A0A922LUX2_SCHHA|nr:Laminin subunit gamma-1 [Schistosoma haematobium]KAH9594385.1 Laminin subunit gamma-1 [Schistosoma haematobium]
MQIDNVEASTTVGLHIYNRKTKILKHNTVNTNAITLDGEVLEDMETFTCMDSIIYKQGGSDEDVNAKIDKERVAFLQLKNIWNSKQMSECQYQNQNLQY